LAGAGRAVKEQSFLPGQPERAQRGTLLGERQHVALERLERRLRKNDFLARDRLQRVDADSPGVARVVVAGLERQDATAVTALFRQPRFERVEDARAQLDAE